ncbi:hypothetical protein D9757_013467 [Collybiopsis confluens]|uniref:Uncharacterized protein n=1 Tax=Collybiopsis confluens TaxID=2823264 RepID=A0A8H5FUB3_9AGAR|nr:hypothetical protein D9757_013467 [Collybiopsis confluens]
MSLCSIWLMFVDDGEVKRGRYRVKLNPDRFKENTVEDHPLAKHNTTPLMEETNHLSPTKICQNIADVALEATREKKNLVDDSDEAVMWPVELDSDQQAPEPEEAGKQACFEDVEDDRRNSPPNKCRI